MKKLQMLKYYMKKSYFEELLLFRYLKRMKRSSRMKKLKNLRRREGNEKDNEAEEDCFVL